MLLTAQAAGTMRETPEFTGIHVSELANTGWARVWAWTTVYSGTGQRNPSSPPVGKSVLIWPSITFVSAPLPVISRSSFSSVALIDPWPKATYGSNEVISSYTYFQVTPSWWSQEGTQGKNPGARLLALLHTLFWPVNELSAHRVHKRNHGVDIG